VVEDRRLELDELRSRVEAQLFGQHVAGAGVRPERVGLPSGSVQGDHQAPGEALAQRMLLGRPLQLARRLGVAPEGEQGVEAALERGDAQLAPRDRRRAGPLLVGDVGEGRPAPLVDGRVELGEGDVGGVGHGLEPLRDEVLEPGDVELVTADGQDVAGPLPTEEARIAQPSAEQRDVALERVDRRRRRVAGPDVLDEAVDGDHLPAADRQTGKHGALTRPAE
jgi:hypothetical protein